MVDVTIKTDADGLVIIDDPLQMPLIIASYEQQHPGAWVRLLPSVDFHVKGKPGRYVLQIIHPDDRNLL